ncbi:glycosyltransferase [Moheibacter stercoris]|uniref:Glycosyltransferase involved in cell wall biosynthesis n=1 Tax=Moheibacter stercoris TaxID=1628251 RepID=A0ABV2LSI4_9FLAO
MKGKRVLVADWLDLYGGAEKVITILDEIINFDEVYTLTDIRKPEDKHLFFKGNPKIHSTKLQVFGKYFRYLLPLFPYFVKQIKIDPNSKFIFSSSHNIAKGISKTSADQIHYSYIQSRNLKYIWDDEQIDLYFGKFKFLILPFVKYLQKYDVQSAQKPDLLIANSLFQKQWLWDHYHRDSVVIYPPVDLSTYQLYTQKEDYYVAVGRFAKMKRFDILIDAFNQMPDKKLILIGDGELNDQFRKTAKSNIQFTGFLNSDKVYEYVKKAKAAIYIGIEDFGIAAVEAQACGTPVIAIGNGGTAETILHKKTGILVENQNVTSLIKSVEEFESHQFDYEYISKHSQKFSKKEFINSITNLLSV